MLHHGIPTPQNEDRTWRFGAWETILAFILEAFWAYFQEHWAGEFPEGYIYHQNYQPSYELLGYPVGS